MSAEFARRITWVIIGASAMIDASRIVVGTDTGVGKTRVAAALLVALRARGFDVVPMKPIQTGAELGRAPDLDFCLQAANLPCDAALYDRLAPYRFALPASPHLAAREAGATIEAQRVWGAWTALRDAGHGVIVEAAGGVLVPLSDALLQMDLLLGFDLPFLVVARPDLGTLNHTLLTLEALKNRNARIGGIVLNATRANSGLIEEDNARTLAARNPDVPLHCFPFMPDPTRATLEKAGADLLATLHFQ